MNDETLDTFLPVSLTYSAASYGDNVSQPAPEVFYNAFPELNDVSLEDKSKSAFPRRAKYNFPLDSAFIPSGKVVGYEDLSEMLLEALPEDFRETVVATFKRSPNTTLMVPCEPTLIPIRSGYVVYGGTLG